VSHGAHVTRIAIGFNKVLETFTEAEFICAIDTLHRIVQIGRVWVLSQGEYIHGIVFFVIQHGTVFVIQDGFDFSVLVHGLVIDHGEIKGHHLVRVFARRLEHKRHITGGILKHDGLFVAMEIVKRIEKACRRRNQPVVVNDRLGRRGRFYWRFHWRFPGRFPLCREYSRTLNSAVGGDAATFFMRRRINHCF
jgi:hypothetical protein